MPKIPFLPLAVNDIDMATWRFQLAERGAYDIILNELDSYYLKFEKECLDFHKTKRPIKTVSSAQARKPLYDSSMSSYKKYEEFMKDIFQKIDSLR